MMDLSFSHPVLSLLRNVLPVVMARFATDCARCVRKVTRKLEVKLGPETSSLGFRFALHSGPVTGGVLRGQRARFQIFGDVVNTAARIESTGRKGRIHVSTVTANLLRDADRGSWVIPREDRVLAKGIGVIQTWWLLDDKIGGGASVGIHHGSQLDTSGRFRDEQVGLVDWHTESLARFLKVVVAQQQTQVTFKESCLLYTSPSPRD